MAIRPHKIASGANASEAGEKTGFLAVWLGARGLQAPGAYLDSAAPSGKICLFTKKNTIMEMPPLSTVVPML